MTVFKVRSHWRALAIPLLVTLFLVALGIVLMMLRGHVAKVPHYGSIVWVLMALIWLPGAFVPFLKWWFSTDTLTTNQLRSDEGVIRRSSTTIPLERVAATNVERTVMDRLFRSGTIQVQTAGSDSTVELRMVARASLLERMINDQVQQVRNIRASGD